MSKLPPYQLKETRSQKMRNLYEEVGSQPTQTASQLTQDSQTQSSIADNSFLDSSLLTSTPINKSKSNFSKTSPTQESV